MISKTSFYFNKLQIIVCFITFIFFYFLYTYLLNQNPDMNFIGLITDSYLLEVYFFPICILYSIISSRYMYTPEIRVRLVDLKSKLSYLNSHTILIVSTYIFINMSSLLLSISHTKYLYFFIINHNNIFTIATHIFSVTMLLYFISLISILSHPNKLIKFIMLILAIIFIVDYFIFFSRLLFLSGLLQPASSTSYFIRNIFLVIVIMFNLKTINTGLIKREFFIRLNHVIVFIVIFFPLVLLLYIDSFSFHNMSFMEFYVNSVLFGVHNSDISELINGSWDIIPVKWIIIQLMYLLLLSNSRYEDLKTTGSYITIRLGRINFNKIKNYSLFIVTFMYVLFVYIIPLILTFNLNYFSSYTELLYYVVVVIIVNYFWGIFYEYLSLLVTPKISLTICSFFIIINVFSIKFVNLGFSMVAHWEYNDFNTSHYFFNILILILTILTLEIIIKNRKEIA